MRKILGFLFATAVVLLGLAYAALNTWGDNPIMKVPFPYVYKDLKHSSDPELEQTQILVIGDQMVKELENYRESFTDALSKGLQKNLTLSFYWRKHMSLARATAKLKSLEKLPPVIIYHGGVSELLEDRLPVEHLEAIKTNFKRYEKGYLSVLIELYPALSKLIYHTLPRRELGPEIQLIDPLLDDQKVMARNEMVYKMYQYELREFIKFIASKNSQLIFLNVPINLETPPARSCDASLSPELSSVLQEAKERDRQGNYKGALNILNQVQESVRANADYFYLLGKISLKSGN